MRRSLLLPALAVAMSLAGCGTSPPQSPASSAETFRTLANHVADRPLFGFFREFSPADHANCLGGPLSGVLRRLGDLEATPCTVTGSGNIAVDAFGRVVAFTVNVSQPVSGSPTGTVTLTQTIQPPFNLQSSSITSVVCAGGSTTITGTLVQGGTFRLNATDYAVGPDYIEVFTPYYSAGGPVVSGGITVNSGAATFPGSNAIKPQHFLCPPIGPKLREGKPLF